MFVRPHATVPASTPMPKAAPACWPAPQIVLHPRWGSSVYPASMFTRAPPEVLASAIAATEQEVAGRQGA